MRLLVFFALSMTLIAPAAAEDADGYVLPFVEMRSNPPQCSKAIQQVLNEILEEEDLTNIDQLAEKDLLQLSRELYKKDLPPMPTKTLSGLLHFTHKPWDLSLHPESKTRLASAFNSLLIRSEKDLLNAESYFGDVSNVIAESKNLSNIFDTMLTNERTLAKRQNLTKGYDTYTKLSSKKGKLICATYNILKADKCAKAMQQILEFMQYEIVNGFEITGISLYQKVLADPIYYEGAQKAALRIYRRLKDPSMLSKEADLFEDIQNSFIDLKIPPAEAYQRTWDLLGLISTRGQNIGSFFETLSNDKFGRSLQMIAGGSTYLDHFALEKGFSYSLPKTILTHIDTGKPYHFWMTSYLSRMIAKEYDDPFVGNLSGWLMQLGYQMRSKTVGRDPSRAFYEISGSRANNRIRMDLTYGAAGSSFGSHSIEKHSAKIYDIDNGFLQLLKKRGNLKPMSIDEAEKFTNEGLGIEPYFRWKKLFKPDLVFDLYK